MNRLRYIALTLIALWLILPAANAGEPIRPGQLWKDNRGVHINAHGGGVMHRGNRYYWYGEHKADSTSSARVGVTCYSSRNLTDWTYEGVALAVTDEAGHDLERGCVLERPKVIYCPATGKYVMWFHLELKGSGYAQARYGVAVADKPAGPFRFLRSGRVNEGIYPLEFSPRDVAALDTLNAEDYKDWWTPAWYGAIERGLFVKRDLHAHTSGRHQLPGGQMARDMTLYVDADGTAYHIYSSEDNLTLQIAELTPDYTAHTGRYIRVAPGRMNEAPAVFRHEGTYWMITSGCTGWAPNKARMFSAPSIWGPWVEHDSPCRGPEADLTFGGQSTYVLETDGRRAPRYIFMADIWHPQHPSDARYVWLPIEFENGVPVIRWQEEWTMQGEN